MRAQIRYFHSPDVDSLEEFRPDRREDAGALIQMMLSPAGEPGEESFQIVVGTAEYLSTLPPTPFTLTVDSWDFPTIRAALESRIAAADGSTWEEIAQQITTWAQWEFDGYRREPGHET